MNNILSYYKKEVLAITITAGVIAGSIFLAGKTEKQLEVENKQIEESISFLRGTIRALSRLKMEYELAQSTEKEEEVARTILELSSTFDINLIEDEELRQFIVKIKKEYERKGIGMYGWIMSKDGTN